MRYMDGGNVLEEYLKDKAGLLDSFLTVASQLINRGELMKAYIVLHNAPAAIEDAEEVLNVLSSVRERLEQLSSFQRYGTWDGKYNAGFVLPDNPKEIPKFKKLVEKMKNKSLKKMVDVGCFSGWVGRELSLEGIAVHGIDIHPVVNQIAAFANSGSFATFEYLTAEKLGVTHLREFDGAIIFDSWEHSFDPEVFIRSVERSVKNEGWVFINVPSVEGEQEANLHEMGEHEHMYSFTKKNIEKLLSDKNPEIETIYENGVPSWFITYQI